MCVIVNNSLSMEDINLTQSYYVSQSSLVNRTRNIVVPNEKMDNQVEQILFSNVNRSYLAKISGNSQSFKKKGVPSAVTKQKLSKRINFDAYEGVATNKINQSNLSSDWNLFQVVSFTNDQGVQLHSRERSFGCCQDNNIPLICKARLDGTTFQLLRHHPDKLDIKQELYFVANFDTLRVLIQHHSMPNHSSIIIKLGTYVLALRPLQAKTGKWWAQQLETMMTQSKGHRYSLGKILEIPEFYKRRFQTQAFFTANCENGDLLLFEDSHLLAKVQRLVTRSSFDHVGLVVRDRKHGILIFESNSGSGVCLTPWKYLVMFGWYRSIPRVTWRRLQVERKGDFDTKLQNFVIGNLPKQFHFSLAKLISTESFIMVEEEGKQGLQSNESDGYFCSELVAKTYKQLGLLVSDKNDPRYLPSSRFYPRDFSEAGGLQLEHGKLGEEKDIVFERELLMEDYPNMD